MSGPITPPLTVTTASGTPSGRPITTIKVSDGDLTISGGIATIDTSGSGGSPATPAKAIQFNSDPAGTFTGSSRLLFDTDSNAGRIEMSSGAAATQPEIRTMTGRGLQISSTDTDESIRNSIVVYGEADSPDGIALYPATGLYISIGDSTSTPAQITTRGASANMVLTTNLTEDKAKITLEAGAGGGVVVQTDAAGFLQLENTTTDTDSVFSIMGNGTGDAKIDLQNASKRVWVLCDENKKLKIQGGAAGNTFVFDVSGAATGLTFPDGTTQTTAASGGTPAGSDTELQFNNAGAFGASSDLTWDGTYLMSDKISSTASTDLNLYGGSATSGKITLLNGFGNHIKITPSGTGDVKLQADQIIVGDDSGPAAAIITTDGAGDLTLSTNKGTDSGTVVITDGADGDISLTPDGTGAVEISGAYKLPTAVTGANDYVLTAQTDGSTAWAASGGGGAGITLPNVGSTSETMYLISQGPIWGVVDTSATVALTSVGKCFAYPFIAPKTGNLSELLLSVSTADAVVDTCYLAIYSQDADNLPETLLGYGSMSVASTGASTQTSLSATISLTEGEQYWFSINMSATGTSAVLQATSYLKLPNVGIGSSITETGVALKDNNMTEFAVPPSTLQPSYVYSGFNRPMVAVKYA